MKKGFLLFTLGFGSVFADYSWTFNSTPFTPNGITTSSLVQTGYYPPTGEIIQIWQNTADSCLYYSTYNGSTWTNFNEAPISTTVANTSVIFPAPAYDPNSSLLMLVWNDMPGGNLPYATFNGGTWSAGLTPINGETSITGSIFSSPFYDSQSELFFTVWPVYNSVYNVFAATYSNGMWSTPTQIESDVGGVVNTFCTLFNDGQGTIVSLLFGGFYLCSNFYDINTETWQTPSQFQYDNVEAVANPVLIRTNNALVVFQGSGNNEAEYNYVYYDPYSNRTWTAQLINLNDSSDKVSTQMANTIQFGSESIWVQAFVDGFDPSPPIYSSTFNGSTWSSPNQTVPLGLSDEGVYILLNPIYDTTSNQIILIWQGLPTYQYYYSTFDGTNWNTPANNLITNTDSITFSNALDPIYDPQTQQTLLVLQDNMGNLYYATYQANSPPPPSATLSLSGNQKVNNFGIVKEHFNTLSWSIDATVSQYSLFRNGTLIVTLNGSATFYEDHNQPNSPQTYTLEATLGDDSQISATITIGGK